MNEQFAKDFIKAQSEIGTLPKDKKGYGYNYTDFDTVVKTVKPILKTNHIGFCQMLDTKENGKSGITTILIHESGESVQSWFELPSIVLGKANNAQNIGGAISYIKRYALCAILGCSSDDDIDCNVPNSNGYTQNNNNQNNAQSNGQNRQGMPNNQNRPQNPQQNNGGYNNNYQR